MVSTIHLLITEPLDKELVDRVISVSPRLTVHQHVARKAEDLPAALVAETEVLYTLNALPEPASAPCLRWVQFHRAGLDRVGDHPLLRAGVQFTSLSGAAASQMGEYVVMMMLALGHGLSEMAALKASKEWPKNRWEHFLPTELRSATVGIIGYGSVGREVARLCRAFGAKVLAIKNDAMHPEDPGFTPEGLGDPRGEFPDRIYPPEALARVLAESDFILVSAPLTARSRSLLGGEAISAAKRGAFLIDVSRGGLLEEAAVLGAVRDGILAGAAMDVFAQEPLPPDSPLWEEPRIILSPHIAGVSREYDVRAVDLFVVNLRRYLLGQPLLNLFDPARGY
ncbi:MAG: D-2-hydroxyacid dehydrogenase [Anaerolineales bacterium]|jgi:phosphoglycerate dehydrogenase-like enzyme